MLAQSSLHETCARLHFENKPGKTWYSAFEQVDSETSLMEFVYCIYFLLSSVCLGHLLLTLLDENDHTPLDVGRT